MYTPTLTYQNDKVKAIYKNIVRAMSRTKTSYHNCVGDFHENKRKSIADIDDASNNIAQVIREAGCETFSPKNNGRMSKLTSETLDLLKT